LRWIASDSFVVVRLGKGPTFCRSCLRFKSPEEASQVATILKRGSSVLEEPLIPVEEFSVQVRLLITARYVVLLVYVAFWNVLVGLFLFLLLGALGTFGLVAGVVALIGYSGLPLWAAIVRARRRTKGWLRVQGRSVVVRSLDWIPVFPKLIEWKSPQVIVLSGRGTKYELTFPTTESLTRAVTRIRTAYPQVQEILAETYKQDSL